MASIGYIQTIQAGATSAKRAVAVWTMAVIIGIGNTVVRIPIILPVNVILAMAILGTVHRNCMACFQDLPFSM